MVVSYKLLFSKMSLLWLLGLVLSADTTKGRNYFERMKAEFQRQNVTSQSRPKNSFVPKRFYNTPKNCNPHDFKYTKNEPSICSKHDRVFLVFAIRTIFSHYDRRMTIRNTWGRKTNFNATVELVFLFANTGHEEVQRHIQIESDMYRDIVQEDFLESYTNMTLKAVMAWKWALNFCPNAEFVMVMNDEALVDPFKIVPVLQQKIKNDGYTNSFTFCFYLSGKSRHMKMKKFSLLDPLLLYEGKIYPPFCHGVAYVAPIQLINKLYLMSLETPHVMPSDIWIGIMAEKLGVRVINSDKYFVGIHPNPRFLKLYSSPKYSENLVIIGITDLHCKGMESLAMVFAWNKILKYRQLVSNKNKVTSLTLNKINCTSPTNDYHYYYICMIIINIFSVLIFMQLYRRRHIFRC